MKYLQITYMIFKAKRVRALIVSALMFSAVLIVEHFLNPYFEDELFFLVMLLFVGFDDVVGKDDSLVTTMHFASNFRELFFIEYLNKKFDNIVLFVSGSIAVYFLRNNFDIDFAFLFIALIMYLNFKFIGEIRKVDLRNRKHKKGELGTLDFIFGGLKGYYDMILLVAALVLSIKFKIIDFPKEILRYIIILIPLIISVILMQRAYKSFCRRRSFAENNPVWVESMVERLKK